MPNSPLIVERLLLKPELEAHRDEVNDWLRANDIDPALVLPDWISIETRYSATVICFRQYKVDEHGKKIKDPEQPDRAWSEVRTVTLQAWLRPIWLKTKPEPATPAPAAQFVLHIATEDGRLALVDITDLVNRAHFTRLPDGTPGLTDVSDALPGLPDATMVHRIMLVTCINPYGTGADPNVTVDPEAARWLSLQRAGSA